MKSCKTGPNDSESRKAGSFGLDAGKESLLANSKLLNHRTVPIHVFGLQVVEKTPPFSDHLKQASARMMVLRINLEMFSQIADPLTKKCNLNFGRTGIRIMSAVGIYHFYLSLSCQWQRYLRVLARMDKRKIYHMLPGPANFLWTAWYSV